MSKTFKQILFDSDEKSPKRHIYSYVDRKKAKQELRVFISAIEDYEQGPCRLYR